MQRQPVGHLVERVQLHDGGGLPGGADADGPGSGKFSGQPVSVTQPTFQWQTVPGTDQYALYIRQLGLDGSQGG